MSDRSLTNVLRYLYRRTSAVDGDTPTDGQLLARFVNHRDEAAFEVLVQRHAAVVWQACRRLLPDPADADDAFQATFLVLLRRAGSLDGSRSLAGWLFGVARRVAQRARIRAARRREQERHGTHVEPEQPAAPPPDDLRSLLDAELAGLPEKYRTPLVLCYLQGKTNESAARELGWAPGSMASRLARGRELLRERLVSRGVSLSSAVLTAVLVESAASAAPAPLVTVTLTASLAYLTHRTAVGGFSASATALAEGVLRSMLVSKLKTVSLVILFAGALVAGTGVFLHHAMAARNVLAPLPRVPAAEADAAVDPKANRLLFHTEGDRIPPNPFPLVTVGHFPEAAYRKLIEVRALSKPGAVVQGVCPLEEPRAGKSVNLLLVGPRLQSSERCLPVLIQRRDHELTLVFESWTDNGDRLKNVPGHEAHVLPVGNLDAGDYKLRLVWRHLFRDAAHSAQYYRLKEESTAAVSFRVLAADAAAVKGEKLPSVAESDVKPVLQPLAEGEWLRQGADGCVNTLVARGDGIPVVRAGTFDLERWSQAQLATMPALTPPTADSPLYATVRGPTLSGGEWMMLREIAWKDKHVLLLRVDVWRDREARKKNETLDPLLIVPLNAPKRDKDKVRSTLPGEYHIDVELTMLRADTNREPYQAESTRTVSTVLTIK